MTITVRAIDLIGPITSLQTPPEALTACASWTADDPAVAGAVHRTTTWITPAPDQTVSELLGAIQAAIEQKLSQGGHTVAFELHPRAVRVAF